MSETKELLLRIAKAVRDQDARTLERMLPAIDSAAARTLPEDEREIRETLEGMVSAFDTHYPDESIARVTRECAVNEAKRILGWETARPVQPAQDERQILSEMPDSSCAHSDWCNRWVGSKPRSYHAEIDCSCGAAIQPAASTEAQTGK